MNHAKCVSGGYNLPEDVSRCPQLPPLELLSRVLQGPADHFCLLSYSDTQQSITTKLWSSVRRVFNQLDKK